MSISNPNIRENLKYNYGTVFNKLLKFYHVQIKFYSKEMRIGKSRWYSTCQGKVYFPEVDKLYEQTGIDKNILNGIRKFKITSLADKDTENELSNIILLLENNPTEFESNKKNGDYDKNFIRLFDYVFSIANKINSEVEDKFNDVINKLDNIKSRDYMDADTEVLDCYKKLLKEHLDIASAAITVKKF
ncbi:hypothetical protein DVV95_11140 [Clostridium botulinum]|uniref:hypothetical protein n=1 Tax=Clostridium botulinum TaxID=1491 RepID=UPI000A178636|nr:hypothetical protein [Clostridium botulinum]MBN1062368.1 hypothetical protein [Clostridium botulinum]